MAPLLAAALLLSPGTAALRWEHQAVAGSPLESALELAFDDPAAFFGPEARGEDGRDRVLESRLALSQRFGRMLFSANATLATNLRFGVEHDFGYAAALTWTEATVALGVQAFGGMGDTHAFLEPPCRRHYLAPTVFWSFAPGWVLRAQAARQAASSGNELVRLQLAYEF